MSAWHQGKFPYSKRITRLRELLRARVHGAQLFLGLCRRGALLVDRRRHVGQRRLQLLRRLRATRAEV